MWAVNRYRASLVYLISLVATLYAAWKIRHFYIVLPCVIIQFGAMIWYIASYIPYGRGALSRIFRIAFRTSLLPI